MRVNPVKAALNAGETVVGVVLQVATQPSIVRIMANAGYDFVFLDNEHSLVPSNALLDMVQMARATGISPLVRPADTEYHLLARMLDTGADGLIVPRVENREQARHLVDCCKFPPVGRRGCGTTATLDYRGGDWGEAVAWLNEQTMIVPQVESLAAIDALDDILDVPGMDAILVGPLDLSINMGIPGRYHDPAFVAAVERVIAVCEKRHVPSGIAVATPDAVRPWAERGMRFLVCGFDGWMLLDTATAYVEAIRSIRR